VFNIVVKDESADLGVTLNSAGTNAPLSAQLKGYRSAQWTCAAFALMGEFTNLAWIECFVDVYCHGE
jgi:hypothetical protein